MDWGASPEGQGPRQQLHTCFSGSSVPIHQKSGAAAAAPTSGPQEAGGASAEPRVPSPDAKLLELCRE